VKRYDSTAETQPTPAESPLAVKAVGGAAGLMAGTLLLCLALDVPFERGWRIAAGLGALCLGVAGLGAFRRVAHYALGELERVIRVDLNADGQVGPDIRLVPVKSSTTIGVERGMDADDLRYMISRLDYDHQRGWTVREWLNERLPSGREIISADVGPYAEFIAILERMGALVGRGERAKGQLTMRPDEILAHLGL